MTDTDILGIFRRDGDDLHLRLEKTYDTDVHDIWSALTDPIRLARWFARTTGELRLGGEFLILFDLDHPDDPAQRVTGSVVECVPAERFVITWCIEGEPPSTVSVDLNSDGDGARVVLEEQRVPLGQAAGYGAGWQAYLEQLGADLAGGEGPGSRWDQRWAELVPFYRARLED